MIQYIFLGFFFTDFVIHIFSEIIENRKLRYLTKPLLVPLIILYYLFNIPFSSIIWLLVIALIFGWIGDLALMMGRGGTWFMLGLGGFLVGHIFYIITYILFIENILLFPPIGWLLLIPLLVITILIYTKIHSKMGDLKIPTIIYIITIFLMGLFALFLFAEFDLFSFLFVYFGAILFIISDGIIALDKFHKNIQKDRVYVMITYGLAQLFITQGIIVYQIL